MHRIVGRPILFSLVVALFIYVIPLLIVEVNGPADAAASIVSGILMLLIAGVASVFEYLFFREYFDPHKDPVALNVSIWGILNTLFVTTHIVANVGYAIWLFDLSPGKDQVFLGVPGPFGGSGYHAYISGFLVTASNFVLQTGIIPLQFANGNVWGSLWSIGGGFIGVVLVTLLLGVVMRSVTMRVYRPM